MARLVVAETEHAGKQLWVLTDDDNPSEPPEAATWPGPKVAIHNPTPTQFHHWKLQLQRHEMSAACPSCRNRLHVKGLRIVDDNGANHGRLGWHWHHNRVGSSCTNTAGESARHVELKHRGAEIAAACGLTVDVERRFPGFQVDVYAVSPEGRQFAYEPEVSGHRNAGELTHDHAIRQAKVGVPLWDMSPSAYRQELSYIPQLLRHGDTFVDGVRYINRPDDEAAVDADVALEAYFTQRIVESDGLWLITNDRGVRFKRGRRVPKPVSFSTPAAVAPLTPWHQHTQPNSAPPGPHTRGPLTPSSSTAASSAPSTPWTQPTLFAEPSKNSPTRPPSPGSAQQLKPTGTDGTHPTPSATTAAVPTPSEAAPTCSQPKTTAPALTVVTPTPSTPNASSPTPPPSTSTTTATAPASAPSAGNTTSPGTSVPATPPSIAGAATTCDGHGVAYPPVRCVDHGDPDADLVFWCPRCHEPTRWRFYGPCPACRGVVA